MALTEEQKAQIKSLKEVARQGVFWISQHRTKPLLPAEIGKDEQSETIFETRTKFLYHAGHLATSGILTQRQAEQVGEIILDWGR